MKKLITRFILYSAACSAVLALTACNPSPCAHVYDNACDAICNHCEEERHVDAHHYTDADCNTPKTCSICGATDGSANGHTWTSANCNTPKTCSICGATDGSANGHIPNTDDNDCTTPIQCVNCHEIITPAMPEHIDNDHNYVCDNEGCQVKVGKEPSEEDDGLHLPLDKS